MSQWLYSFGVLQSKDCHIGMCVAWCIVTTCNYSHQIIMSPTCFGFSCFCFFQTLVTEAVTSVVFLSYVRLECMECKVKVKLSLCLAKYHAMKDIFGEWRYDSMHS
jgi:hypothetical protein